MPQMQVMVGLADLRREPSASAPLDTQAQFGELVRLDGPRGVPGKWVRGVLETDGYHGYLPRNALGSVSAPATHRVSALRTYLYPSADMKAPPREILSMGARVTASDLAVSGNGTARPFAAVDGRYVIADHLVPLVTAAPDWVAVAELFVGTPYLWSGKSSIGLDCSALVQIALDAAGRQVTRDTGDQEAEFSVVTEDIARQRGDLAFWRGHVGIMVDSENMLHANAHHMATAIEPLAGAVERITANGGGVIGIRRP